MSKTSQRGRSHWAWGYADRQPVESVRPVLAAQAKERLGFDVSPLPPAAALDSIELPAPRVTPPAAWGFASCEREARIRHTYGRGYLDILKGYRGDFANPPDIVAHPETEAEIVEIYQWAQQNEVAVVPYGGGTSVVDGVLAVPLQPQGGVLTLSLSRFDKLLELDRTSLLCRMQAGMTGPAIEEALGAHGLTLRHFPQSFEFSTLGGWLATHAGGHFATGYTHIDDLTHSLRLVSPAGTIETLAVPQSGAGPYEKAALLGSEGIYGIITEGTMRVRPRPDHRAKASVHFKDFAKAVEAVRQLAQSGLMPANCRLLDANEARLNQVTRRGTAVVLLGFEAHGRPVDGALMQALAITNSLGGECPKGPQLQSPDADGAAAGKGAGAQWKDAFLDAPYLQSGLISLGVVVDTFETACTWEGFFPLYEDMNRRLGAVMKEQCGEGKLSCRFTHAYPDGPAPYFTFLAPGEPGREEHQWKAIKDAAFEVLVEHGATITHHHAVGRMHRPWHWKQRSPLWRKLVKASKATLDPAGILNPGVLVSAGEREPEHLDPAK